MDIVFVVVQYIAYSICEDDGEIVMLSYHDATCVFFNCIYEEFIQARRALLRHTSFANITPLWTLNPRCSHGFTFYICFRFGVDVIFSA